MFFFKRRFFTSSYANRCVQYVNRFLLLLIRNFKNRKYSSFLIILLF